MGEDFNNIIVISHGHPCTYNGLVLQSESLRAASDVAVIDSASEPQRVHTWQLSASSL